MNSEILEQIKEKLPTWSVKDNKLRLELSTKNWLESMNIANMISFLAEKENHHPDLTVKYGSLTVELFTHTSGDISEQDLSLALKINELLL